MRPARETVNRSGQTFFVSSQTVERQPFFRHERWAILMQDIFQHYRGESYLLHAYVVMPDHFHLLISPKGSLERAMQKIKGGFSFRAKSAFGWKYNIWQPWFSDHRIRDAQDWDCHIAYMRHNPVKNKLCLSSEDYRYLAVDLDPIPQRLKPVSPFAFHGGAEAPPLQKPLDRNLSNPATSPPLQNLAQQASERARPPRTEE
jgi:putative transposase